MITYRVLTLFSLLFASAVFAAAYPFNNPVLGKTPAPFTLEYFSGYDCQYCDEFEANVLPALAQDVEAGRLRIVFRDLPPDNSRVRKLTERVFCSQHDVRYLEFRSQLKRDLRQSVAAQSTQATPAELDTESSRLQQSCLKDSRYLSVLNHNKATFDKYGFQGTPAFVLTRTVDDGYDQMAWSGATGIHSIMRLLSSSAE